MKFENIIVNSVPSITWNWLQSNKDVITVEGDFSEKKADYKSLPAAVKISTTKTPENFPFIPTGVFNKSTPKVKDNRNADGSITETRQYQDQGNAEHPLVDFLNQTMPEAEYLEISGKAEEPVILNYDFKKASVSKQIIHAKENSEATIIFMFTGNAEASILQTKVYAEANSKLHIIKVQLMGEITLQLDDTGIAADDNADVKYTLIELGGLHVDNGLHVNLNGYQSKFTANSAYICQKNQYYDFNHTVYHFGKKSECQMRVNGTIKDDAKKTYRGTLDFKKGCAGSAGNELEETLILCATALNKSLPVILCDEDDISGEHGASIGRLGADVLFYMQTRGISKEEAEKLMARAKVQAVVDLIPSDEIKDQIKEFLDKQ